MILIIGSTGLVGSEICRQLRENNRNVRALVRKTSAPEKLEALRSMGCSLFEGDLKDTESLKKACEGIEAIISTASSTLSRQDGDSIQSVDYQGQLNLVQAAKETGVKQFIFISFPDEPEYDNSLNQAKRAVEKALAESKMNYTSLQANYFMEVWLSPALGFDHVNQSVRIYGSGTNKTNWISFVDVAKFAVHCVDNPLAFNKIIPVGGPEALSPLEVVGIFEEKSGKKFSVEHVPVEALKSQRENASNPLEEAFACLMLCYAKGWEMDMEKILNDFPISLTSVEDYAQSV